MSFWSNHRSEFAVVITLGLPLALSHVAQVAMGALDTLMMGWYGVTELAALTVAGSLWFLCFMAISGMSWALTPLVAEAAEAAEQDDADQRIRRVTRMGFWLVTGLWLLAFGPMWFSEALMLWLGQTPEVAHLAQDYLRITCFSMLPAVWSMVLKSYLAALQHTAISLWVTAGAILPNAVLNYLLIFGVWGFPEMGVQGAALATILVAIGAFWVLMWYANHVFPQHSLFVRLWRIDGEAMWQVFRLGLPISITSVSEVGLFAGSAFLMGAIGELPLAAHGIALNIASLTFVMHLGISQAGTVRAGRAMGRKTAEDLRRVGRVAMILSFGMAMCTCVMFLSIPEVLIGAFLSPDDPQKDAIISLGVMLLAMAALFQLVDGAQVVGLGLLRGIQDTFVPMVIAAVSYWVIGFPLSYYLGLSLEIGPLGVWTGLVCGLTAAGAALIWRFWRLARQPKWDGIEHRS